MTVGSWILEGVFFWLGGYLYSRNKLDERLLIAPKWLWVMCGFPRNKSINFRTLSLGGLFLQLWGWILVIYGLITQGKFPGGDIIGQLLGIIIGAVVAKIVFHFYRVKQ